MYTRMSKLALDLFEEKNWMDLAEFTGDNFYKNWNYSIDRELEKKDAHAKEEGHFGFIPSDPLYFIDFMLEFVKLFPDKDLNKVKFIDVGSGHGDKVFLAGLFGLDSYGIEYTKETFYFSTILLGRLLRNKRIHIYRQDGDEGEVFKFHNYYEKSNYNYEKHEEVIKKQENISLINGDAIEFDYSEFDLIYTYQPIIDNKFLRKLYERIRDTMKVGAYWFEVSDYRRSQLLGLRESHLLVTKNILGKLAGIKSFNNIPHTPHNPNR